MGEDDTTDLPQLKVCTFSVVLSSHCAVTLSSWHQTTIFLVDTSEDDGFNIFQRVVYSSCVDKMLGLVIITGFKYTLSISFKSPRVFPKVDSIACNGMQDHDSLHVGYIVRGRPDDHR